MVVAQSSKMSSIQVEGLSSGTRQLCGSQAGGTRLEPGQCGGRDEAEESWGWLTS